MRLYLLRGISHSVLFYTSDSFCGGGSARFSVQLVFLYLYCLPQIILSWNVDFICVIVLTKINVELFNEYLGKKMYFEIEIQA